MSADSGRMADMVISVRVEKSGRVLIPAAVRRRLGLKEGESELLLKVDETSLVITTRAHALRRIQEWAAHGVEPDRRISEEFLQERHDEAARELGG